MLQNKQERTYTLEHIEDEILNFGVKTVVEVQINFVRSLRDMNWFF